MTTMSNKYFYKEIYYMASEIVDFTKSNYYVECEKEAPTDLVDFRNNDGMDTSYINAGDEFQTL